MAHVVMAYVVMAYVVMDLRRVWRASAQRRPVRWGSDIRGAASSAGSLGCRSTGTRPSALGPAYRHACSHVMRTTGKLSADAVMFEYRARLYPVH